MKYPSRTDYQNAMHNVRAALVDGALQTAVVKRDAMGFPTVASGSFSVVFRVEAGGQTWAIRCFIGDIGDAAKIYAEVGAYLQKLRSPYFVGFEYQQEGIRIGPVTYPIVKMEWVPGAPLKTFLRGQRSNPGMIRVLADAWRKMLAELSGSRIAHGDLQHANLLIRVNGAGPEIRLIDYDTVVVPGLEGSPEPNAGLASYQHPRRKDLTTKHLDVDAFSSIAIYASLAAFARNPALWDDFGVEGSEGLLFSQQDFEEPNSSRALEVLRGLGGECVQLAGALRDACLSKDPLKVPRLEEILLARAWWTLGPSPPQPPKPAPEPQPAVDSDVVRGIVLQLQEEIAELRREHQRTVLDLERGRRDEAAAKLTAQTAADELAEREARWDSERDELLSGVDAARGGEEQARAELARRPVVTRVWPTVVAAIAAAAAVIHMAASGPSAAPPIASAALSSAVARAEACERSQRRSAPPEPSSPTTAQPSPPASVSVAVQPILHKPLPPMPTNKPAAAPGNDPYRW